LSIFALLWDKPTSSVGCRSPPFQSEFLKKIQIGERTMFDNTNPYTLRTEVVGGITRYYVAFTDGQAVLRETEVSRPVYLEFLRFVKVERNLRRFDERHIERFSKLIADLNYDNGW
jgi:hypothetical protein